MKHIDASAFSFAPIDGYEEQVAALHDSQIVHAGRAQGDFALIGRTWNAKITAVLKDGQFAGYFIGREGSISEAVMLQEIDFAPALKAWHLQNGCSTLEVSVPVWNTARVRTLSEIAAESGCGPLEMFRLMDMETNIRLWLQLKASYARLVDGRFVLECEGERFAIEVRGGRVDVQRTSDAPDTVLSRMETQDLLMASMRWIDTDAMPACVEQWFPLPISCQSADGF